MKRDDEVTRILEAWDLTHSQRAAAELAGCDHKTVARLVADRDAGRLRTTPAPRPHVVDEWLPKIEDWVERSRGRVRGDIVHERLRALGYEGSERTTRRVVQEVKRRRRLGEGRVYRPWITEPGLWFQYDFGKGPLVNALHGEKRRRRPTFLFCVWLAWSRYRVTMPIWDRTLPTVIACIDAAVRRFGGVPTYALTDNEKTVSVDHVAGIAIRNPQMVAAMHHYGLTVKTCVPADPESKGGSEATVRIAKADLVPTDANLRPEYETFADVVRACEEHNEKVNGRVHAVTRRVPEEMLAEERERLHTLPAEPYTLVYGESRLVGEQTAVVRHKYCEYSAPSSLRGQQVWVREHGDDIVIVRADRSGAREVGRHLRTIPGSPRIDPSHLPEPPPGALGREPVATRDDERDFLAIGPGAALWLKEAGMAGVPRVRAKMAQAVSLARLMDPQRVDWALGHAAAMQRFEEGDLESIVTRGGDGVRRSADETASLQDGTAAWAGFRS